MDRADVVVVGAGLIGSSIAWRLAARGRRVVLLDRGEPGAEASSAAAGLLQPEAGREAAPPLLRLWLASLARYPEFVAEVREVTGAAFEYRVCGRLVPALDDEGAGALPARARVQAEAGIPCDVLSGDEARRLEPALTPNARAALHFPHHALVDNQRLAPAVVTAAARAGADVRPYEPVVAIATSGGRVAGVVTTRGRIAADVVVNAAGAWAATIGCEDGRTIDWLGEPHRTEDQPRLTDGGPTPLVRPAKGEVVVLWQRPRPFERIISLPGGSVSTRADGRIVVGATVLEAGFSKELTAEGVGRMLDVALSAVPSLRAARFDQGWAGLRPRTPDDQPIVGADCLTGLYWATGHFKTGVLSTPVTADVVTSLIEGTTPPIPVDALGPARFGR